MTEKKPPFQGSFDCIYFKWNYFPASVLAASTIFSLAVIANSTLRFWLLPSGVSFVAIGSAIPKPVVTNLDANNPFPDKYYLTEAALWADKFKLYSAEPVLSV